MVQNFEAGHTDVHNAGSQGKKRVSTDDFVQQVYQAIWENHRFTISVLSDSFPEILRSALYAIMTERLHYCKLCARWVPRMLSDHHKTQWMGAALMFLQCYHDEGEEMFWTKLSQRTRHGSISKLKKQKSTPNSGCILIARVNQRSSSEPSPLESVKLLCSGTKKKFSWWNSWNVAWPSLQPHITWLFNVSEGQFRTRYEECCHQALSFFMTMLGST